NRSEGKKDRAEVPERGPDSEDALPDARVRVAELGRDLAVALSLELAERERPSLALGQGLDRGDDPRKFLLLLDEAGRLGGPVELGVELVVLERLLAQEIDRTVAGDPVEPGTQRDLAPLPVAQRDERLHEGLLDRVLRAGRADQVEAVEPERPL